jgi:hypothetical protein
MRLVIISLCIMTFAVLAVGKATRTDYEFTSDNQFADPGPDPVTPYITRVVNGWVFVKDLPIVGEYARSQGSTETGSVYVEASGKLSEDGANGTFYGTIELTLDSNGMICTGRFRGKRVDLVETLKWILHCPDGSKIQERAEFLSLSLIADRAGNQSPRPEAPGRTEASRRPRCWPQMYPG